MPDHDEVFLNPLNAQNGRKHIAINISESTINPYSLLY